ncbi:MAG: TonB-dependent receptor, partial [Leptospiraceae bacterium]|nr:TonB-dependent receptor [Leptospiraceae bacterium]
EDFRGKYTSLTDILEKEAGVRVRRFGGLGSYSTLSIRGSNANQVKIYIDGIPINNSQGGEINLSDFGFDNLEKIEIYKSGQAFGFSSSAIGGTVNLVTKKGKGKRKTRVNVSGGSFHTFKIGGFHSDSTENLNYSIFAQKEKSDQNFKFKNDNGTPILNTYDDKDDIRKNAWFDRYNLTGTLGFKLWDADWKVLNDFNYRKNGIPGIGNNQTEKVEREYMRNTTSLGMSKKSFFLDNLKLDSRLFYTGARDHLFDPLSEFSSGNTNSKADIQQYGIHIIPTFYLLSYNQIFKLLLANERETFKRDKRDRFDNVQDKSTRKFRNHSTIQLMDEMRFFQKRIILSPSISNETYVDRFNEELNEYNLFAYEIPKQKKLYNFTNYRFGSLFILYKSKPYRLSFKVNAATEKRIPTFLEIFGERGSIVGNTNLKPESSTNYDAGFVNDFKNSFFIGDISLIGFSKKINDMILFVPNSQFTLRPENVDSAIIRGAEFKIKFIVFKDWKLLSNYTYQKAINTSNVTYLNGKYLPLRPLHEWHGQISYNFFGRKMELGFEPIFIGASFRDRTNEYANYQPARWIYNIFYKYDFYKNDEDGRKFSLGLEVRNLLDVRAFDFVGYPLPGRSLFFSLSAVF